MFITCFVRDESFRNIERWVAPSSLQNNCSCPILLQYMHTMPSLRTLFAKFVFPPVHPLYTPYVVLQPHTSSSYPVVRIHYLTHFTCTPDIMAIAWLSRCDANVGVLPQTRSVNTALKAFVPVEDMSGRSAEDQGYGRQMACSRPDSWIAHKPRLSWMEGWMAASNKYHENYKQAH
jgi:hypothetical protein